MRVAAALLALSMLAASPVFAQLGYYYDHAGQVQADPTVANVYAQYARAAAAQQAAVAHPQAFMAAHAHPLTRYVHPSVLGAAVASFNGGYHGPSAGSAFYDRYFTQALPHVAHVDVAPVVSQTGAKATEEVARATKAVTEAIRGAPGAAAAAAAAAGAAVDPKAAAVAPVETHAAVHVEEVETRDIPRCFVCDRADEECRLECKVADESSSGFAAYRFNARAFAGEDWWQERTGVDAVPRVTPRTVRQFCSVTIGGAGDFRAVYLRAFHEELCLMSRLVKRPDMFSKFDGIVEHAFRRGIDAACAVSDPAACLPARLEEAACPAPTCAQCESMVTAALGAATGGDSFEPAAFARVMERQMGALEGSGGGEATAVNRRSIRAASHRAGELYSVATALTGRSDRDRLVIVENVCASFGSPQCGCTAREAEADGAGEQQDDGEGAEMVAAEGEHVEGAGDGGAAEEAAEEGAGPEAAAAGLEGKADSKKSEVDELKAEETQLKAKIQEEENEAKEAEEEAKEVKAGADAANNKNAAK